MFSREKKRPPKKEKIKFLVSFRIFVILSAKKITVFSYLPPVRKKEFPVSSVCHSFAKNLSFSFPSFIRKKKKFTLLFRRSPVTCRPSERKRSFPFFLFFRLSERKKTRRFSFICRLFEKRELAAFFFLYVSRKKSRRLLLSSFLFTTVKKRFLDLVFQCPFNNGRRLFTIFVLREILL